jgi:Na+/proline symporter
MSAVTLLGVSNENYQFGTQFVVINVSYGLATPICAYLFLPVFYNMGVTSAYEVCLFLLLIVSKSNTFIIFLVSREEIWIVD